MEDGKLITSVNSMYVQHSMGKFMWVDVGSENELKVPVWLGVPLFTEYKEITKREERCT
jgi:hypothetical protein